MKNTFIFSIAALDSFGKNAIRLGIVIVFIWIGSLKFFTYEADGIVPFVANSPFMSFFYNHPSDYKSHQNKEGEMIRGNHQWHKRNNTYGFAYGLGIFLIGTSILVALHPVAPLLSMVGSILVFLMTLGTLSFLLTTPESWVPSLGDEHWGFPYLSGRGRLVIKDVVILGGALVTMSQSARLYLDRQKQKKTLNDRSKNMKTIEVPAKAQVSTESQAIFEQIQKKLGKVPNLYAVIGYSAHALQGMLEFEDRLSASSIFTAKEREAVNLIVSQVNSCDYCLAAHTALALMKGFSKDDTIAIRKAEVTEPKLSSIVLLAQSIAKNKGAADQVLQDNFFSAGYTEAALIELIGLITLRSFTNYVFAATAVPVDFPLADTISFD
ncbi:DUF417 family protein [Pedobacter sp. GR22-6]|uniref:DUF417 family protein n=1 Tax=Pedobacter sp. GR22-6 TaxID=3127957 RepID=UPI00307CDB0C